MVAPSRSSTPVTAASRPGPAASVTRRFKQNGPMELSEVAARAAGENFTVGAVLFPRPLRPHIRALYCYARFVDEVGDSFAGDRLGALDELESEVGAAFEGRATWPVLRNVEPTIR